MADDVKAIIGVEVDAQQATAQLRALQSQIQNFTKSMAKSSATAARAQRDFEQDLINNINATKQWNASFKSMGDATTQFAQALSKNKLSLSEYFKYGVGATKTFGRAFDKEMKTVNSLAERRVKALQTQYIQLGKDVNGVMRTIAITPEKLDFSKLETKLAMSAQKMQIFNELLHKGTTDLINFGKNTQWAGRQLMVGFTLPLAAFGAQAGKTFMELEQAAVKFRRVYGDMFTTQAETDAALKGVEDLAKSYTKYGIAVKDTISLAAELAAAGYQGQKLNEAIAQTNRLATLGNIDQQQAMQATISLQNAFNISSQDLAGTINYLNSVENQTVVSLDDITNAIPRVAPVIKALGGDVRDLSVFLAAMEEGGVSAEQGANALKSGLGSLINPTKAASEMLGGLGINIKEIVSTNQGNLMGTVKAFAQALSTLSDFQRQQVLEKLFGKYQYARLGALFNNIIKDGSQANKAMMLAEQSAIELAFVANRELKAVEDATSTRFLSAIEQIKVAIAPIGKLFMQIVTPVIEFGTRALEAFNGLDEGVKRVIATIVGVVAGVGPVLLMTVGLLANGIGNFFKFINLLRNGFLRLTGQYQGVAAGSTMLTEAQLAGIAAADSLAAAEGRVTSALLVQRDAVLSLASAYAQSMSGRMPMGGLVMPGGKTKKYASGVISVPGSGNGDTVPAMLTPGEAVIPAEMAKKYAPLINGMIAGNIPGYAKGRRGEFAHIGSYQSIGAADVSSMLSGVEDAVTSRAMKMINELAQAFGNSLKLNVYGKLGITTGTTTSGQSINNALGKTGVSQSEFLADWDKQGLDRWKNSLKYAGIGLDEVATDLQDLDSGMRDYIAGLDENIAIQDKHVKEAYDFAKKQNRLGQAFDQLSNTAGEVRANISQTAANAAGLPMAAGGGSKGARTLPGGTKVRLGGDRLPFYTKAGWNFRNIASSAIQGIKDSTNQNSPSKEAYDAGVNIGKGAIQGIQSTVDEAIKITDKRSAAVLADRMTTQAGAPVITAQERLSRIKSANRRQALAGLGGKISAASIPMSMIGAGMAMQGGTVGKIGQGMMTASMATGMVSSLQPVFKSLMKLPFFLGPLGLAAGGVTAAFILARKMYEANVKKIADAATKQAEAMTGSANAASEFGAAIGDAGKLKNRGQSGLSSEQASVYYQALTGEQMSSTLRGYTAAQAQGNLGKVAANDLLFMSQNFNMTSKDIQGYMEAAAKATGGNAIDIRAQLIELLYTDPQQKKDLLKDPTIAIDVNARLKELGPTAGSNMLVNATRGSIAGQFGANLTAQRTELAKTGTGITGYSGGAQTTGIVSTTDVQKVTTSAVTNMNLLQQGAERVNLAEVQLRDAYSQGIITLEQYDQSMINVRETRNLLNQSLNQQLTALKDNKVALDAFASSQESAFAIKLDARTDMTDAIKKRVTDFMSGIKDKELKLKAQFVFENSGMTPEQFLIMTENLKTYFPDGDMQANVMASMTEQNISLDKLDQYAQAIKNMPAEARTQFLLDGSITPGAAYAIAAASMGAGSRLLREGSDVEIAARAKAILNSWTNKPAPGGGNGGNGGKAGDGATSGGGGKGGTKKTWVQKQEEKWSKIKSKIALEEAQVDQNFVKNFGDNVTKSLKASGLMNSAGQVVIKIPGGALMNFGSINSQEALDAVKKKIELQVLNLEEKKVPVEQRLKGLNRQLDANNRIQELNQRKIEKINKTYDQQSKALENVAKIQDYINKQRQSQATLAEALSSGDLSAAVRAAQQMQADQTNFIIQNQRDALDAQREAATFSYEEQNKMIDEVNQNIQDQIYNEQKALDAINDQIDAYNLVSDAIDRAVRKLELMRDITKDAITIDGFTMSQAQANADIFGAADTVLGKKGSKKNYYNALDKATYDNQILAGASAQVATLNANKDAFRVDFTNASISSLSDAIVQGLRSATFTIGGSMPTASIPSGSVNVGSTIVNNSSAPVYNISVNVNGTNASAGDIANATVQAIRSYNY